MVLELVLADGVAGAERFDSARSTEGRHAQDDDRADRGLYAAEEDLLVGAGPARRRDFAAGRRCARVALHRLGRPTGPIMRGADGDPSWPPGVVGSITHCPGYAAAATALPTTVQSVGIDAEPDAPLPDGVLDLVATPSERAWLLSATGSEPVPWDRWLFCAKEAVYKAWYPLRRTWLDFGEVEVTPEPGRRLRALVVPRSGDPPLSLHGRWARSDGILVVAVVVPAEPS